MGRYGVFATGLGVGLLWGGWHFLSNIWASAGNTEPMPLGVSSWQWWW